MSNSKEDILKILLNKASFDYNLKKEASGKILFLLKQNSLNFVLKVTEIINTSTDPKSVHVSISTLAFFQKQFTLLTKPEIFPQFFEQFKNTINHINNLFINENKLVSVYTFLFSNLINSLNLNDSKNIQTFLLNLVQKETKFISIVSGIIYKTYLLKTNNLFSKDVILSMIDKTNETIPKIRLYFSLFVHLGSKNDQNTNSLYEKVLTLISNDQEHLAESFRLIADFCSFHTYFFKEHMNTFPIFVKDQIISSSNENVQLNGLQIYNNMLSNEPELCFLNQSFYESSVYSAIRLISLLSEQSFESYELLYSNSLYVTATKLIKLLTKHATSEIFNYFNSIHTSIFVKNENRNLLFGYLEALGHSHGLLTEYYIPNKTELSKFQLEHTKFYDIIEFLYQQETPDKILFAALHTLSTFSKHSSPLFHNITEDKIIHHSFENLEKKSPLVTLEYLKFLFYYFKYSQSSMLIKNFEFIQAEILKLLNTTNDSKIKKELIHILGLIFQKIKINNDFKKLNFDFQTIFPSLSFAKYDDIEIHVSILKCYASIVPYISMKEDIESVQKFISLIITTSLYILNSNNFTNNYIFKLFKVIQKMIGHISVSPYVNDLVNLILKCLDYSCIMLDPFNNFYLTNELTQNQKNKKVYCGLMCESLNLLSSIICYEKEAFSPYSSNCITQIFLVLRNVEFIEEIQICGLGCLRNFLAYTNMKEVQFTDLFKKCFHHFIFISNKHWELKQIRDYIYFMKEIIKTAYKFYSKLSIKNITELIPDFHLIFDSIFKKKQILFNIINRKIEQNGSYIVKNDSHCFYQYSSTFTMLVNLIKWLGRLAPKETISFINEKLLSTIPDEIFEYVFHNFSLELLMIYINLTKDEVVLQQYFDYLLILIRKIEPQREDPEEDEEEDQYEIELENSDIFDVIITHLISFIRNTTLSKDFAIELFNLFSYIKEQNFLILESYRNEASLIDLIIVSLLSQKNLPLTINEKVDVLLDSNLYESNENSYIVPLTIFEFLKDHYEIFDEDNSPIQNTLIFKAFILALDGFQCDITLKSKIEICNKFSLAVKENPKILQRFNEFYNYISSQNAGLNNLSQWYNDFVKLLTTLFNIQIS